MRSLLPSDPLLHEVCLALSAREEPVYLVGGYVRDWLLNKTSHDLDFAVEGPAIPVARHIADVFRGAFVLLDQEHDTARAILKRRGRTYSIDLARTRGAGIVDDLAARDFTVNAMAVNVRDLAAAHPPLLDPTGGQDDLRAGRIRATSARTFQDDPLRLLRAVRQAATLGFAITAETEALIRRDAPLITRPSAERVRDELVQLVGSRDPQRQVREMDRLGLLAPTLPEVAALKGMCLPQGANAYLHAVDTLGHLGAILDDIAGARRAPLDTDLAQLVAGHRAALQAYCAAILSDTRNRTLTLRFTATLQHLDAQVGPGQVATTLRRLRFSNAEIGLAQQIVANQHLPASLAARPPATPRSLYHFFEQLGDAGLGVLLLALASSQADPRRDPAAWAGFCAMAQRLLAYHAQEWPRLQAMPPLVNGADLMRALHLKAGPAIGQLLEAIREAQAVGEISSAAEALQLAQAHLRRPDTAKV